ncbi:MAG: helix-turn-helix domain-containing protein [Henriciella sp.]
MQMKPNAEKIKRWREERLWSQEHLADLAGIGLRTVQRIENGDSASHDSVMALAAAFNVDVSALTFDAEAEAAKAAQRETAQKTAGLRLSFWIHLAGWVIGMTTFAAISISEGAAVMLVPALWWTVGLVSHGVVVALVEYVHRHEQHFPKA